MIKKLWLILTVLSFAVVPYVSAAGQAEYYSDAEMVAFSEIKNFFENFGVVDTNTEAATTMTKADLMKYAVSYFCGAEYAGDDYIETAKTKGFLDPDADEASLSEPAIGAHLAKVMTVGLGYNHVAQLSGGYPMGYMTTADSIGVTKGLAIGQNDDITFYNMLRAFDNSLEILWLEMEINGADISYVLSETKTVLSEVFNLVHYRGLVTAVPGGKLLSQELFPSGRVMIDDELYSTEADSEKYLGMKVDYYVDLDDRSVVRYIGNEYKYNVKEVYDAEMIHKYTDRAYQCYKSKVHTATKTIKLATDSYVIYNGQPATSIKSGDMIPELGRVEFIDNDNNGDADVVFIYSFEVKLVNLVNEKTETIFFDGGEQIDLSELDSVTIRKHSDNKKTSITDIEKGSVVLIATSDDGRGTVIEIITKKVEGKITTISDENISVNDTAYGLVKDYFAKKKFQIGANATFYIDSENRIVAILDVTASEKYGYVIKCYYDNDISEELILKIFDETGDMMHLSLANSFKLNGSNGSDTQLINALKSGAASVQPQLILYTTNSDGKVNSIDTAYNYSTVENYKKIQPSGNDDEESFRLVYSSNLTGDGALKYFPRFYTLGSKIDTSRGQTIFQVPSNTSNATDEDYYIADTGRLQDKHSYTLDAYVSGKSGISPDVFVVFDKGAKHTSEYMGVIKSMYKYVDEDGEIGTRVIAYGPPGADCDAISYDLDLDAIPGYYKDSQTFKMDEGDFVMLSHSDGKLLKASMVLDLETATFNKNSYEYGSYMRTDYGAVYDNIDGVISIAPLDKLAEIERLKSDVENASRAEDIADLKQQIKNIESEFVVYKTALFRQLQVRTIGNGKVVVDNSPTNTYLAYNENAENYSKVMVYSSDGYAWTMVEYLEER